MMRMEDLVFTIKDVFNYFITNILSTIIINIIVVLYLFQVNRNIGFILIIFLIIINLTICIIYKDIKKLTLIRIKKYYKVGNNIDNSYTNLSNILANNKNDFEMKKIKLKLMNIQIKLLNLKYC